MSAHAFDRDAGNAIGDACNGNWAGAGEEGFQACSHAFTALGEGAVGDDV